MNSLPLLLSMSTVLLLQATALAAPAALFAPSAVFQAEGPRENAPRDAAQSSPGQRDPAQRDSLERLLAMLRMPGPEGRESRERAVQQLLGLREELAHETLIGVLDRGDDPDGVCRYLLHELAERFANPNDPIFGHAGGNGGGAAAVDTAQRRRRGYGVALVRRYGGDGVAGEFASAVRRAWLSTDAFERASWIEAVLGGEDPLLRLAAITAAADSRSMNVAPLLAAWLADPNVGAAARSALQRLTFASEPFADLAAFQRWQEANRGKTYLELAEAAARASGDRLAALRADEARHRSELTLELIVAYASRTEVSWKRIQELTLNDEPRGVRRLALQRLSSVVATSEKLGGAPAERVAFLEALHRLLASDPPPPDRAALLEAAAALLEPTDKEALRTTTDGYLRDALQNGEPPMRMAALLGLRRQPTPENRALVVAAARTALSTGQIEVLSQALATLQSRGWSAPRADAADRSVWLATLQSILFDRTAPRAVRESAIQALVLRDRDQALIGEAFAPLQALIADATEVVELRERALVALRALTIDEQRYRAYVDIVLARLADPAPRLREKAATMLLQLPEAPPLLNPAPLNAAIFAATSERLLTEPNEAILKTVLDVVRSKSDQVTAGQVVGRLADKLLEHVRAGPHPGQEFRRVLLLDAMKSLASNPTLELGAWLRAAEVLLQLRERADLRYLLSRQRAAELSADKEAKEPFAAAMRLIVQAALLRAPGEGFARNPETPGGGEAAEVVRALRELESAGTPLVGVDVAVLQVEALVELGEFARAKDLAQPLLQTSAFAEGPARMRLLLATARAAFGPRTPESALEAKRWLDALPRNGLTEPMLELFVEVAGVLQRAAAFKEAIALIDAAREATPPTAPAFRERLLSAAEWIQQADPARRGEAVRWLETHAQLFTGADVAEPMRRRYEATLVRLRNGN